MTPKEIKVGFIGAGTVGKALAVSMEQRGFQVVAVASRSRSSALHLAGMVNGCKAYDRPQEVVDAADLVFVATPDSAIREVAQSLDWRPGQWVVHCSGADSLDPLESARDSGALTAVLHPLQSFASYEQAMVNLPGTTFSIEGEGAPLEFLKALVTDLGGKWILLRPGDKVLYHAAAVMASNYLVTLVRMATDLWSAFGVEQEEALSALMPLIMGTAKNLGSVGLPEALTGPIARGDVRTVEKHLTALQAVAPDLLPAYVEVGLQTVPIALEKGRVSRAKALELRQLLFSYQKVAVHSQLMEPVGTPGSGRE